MLPLPFNPWLILAAAVALGGTWLAGDRHGHHQEHLSAQAAQAEHLQRAIAQADAQAVIDQGIVAADQEVQTRIQTVYRTITQEVTRYAIAHAADDCGLDADGLRLWRAANDGTAPAPAAAQPDGAVPATDPAHGREAGVQPAAESRPGDAAAATVPGTASEPGGLGERADVLARLRATRPPRWGRP